MKYDLIVIGAGPGGYTAAIRASKLGLKTAVIEKGEIGGVCLNKGCIPTKALIEQAEIFKTIKKSDIYAITANFDNFDYNTVSAKASTAVGKLTKGVEFLLKKNGVEVIKAKVDKIDAENVYFNNQKIKCKHILIATGSKPASIKGLEPDGESVMNSDQALFLNSLPKSVAIVGAGAIGVEFAYILSSFGSKVILIEMANEILPGIEVDISRAISRAFKKDKIKMYTKSKAEIIQKDAGSVKVKIVTGTKEQEIEVEKVLSAVGRVPVVNFELPNEVGVDEKGFISVDKSYKTSVESIYAIGDVVNTPLLAHVASKEGEVAVEAIAKSQSGEEIDFSSVPYAVYSQPQAAGFGYSSASQKNDSFASHSMFFKAVGKAVAVEKTDGLLKIYYNKESLLIEGAHVCGYNASEIVHELILAKEAKVTIKKLANTVHVHPSFSEIIMEAAKEICFG